MHLVSNFFLEKFALQICFYIAIFTCWEIALKNFIQKFLFSHKVLIGVIMAELKGSKTEQNLWTAFAGESQARNKYSYYASAAKKAGFNQVAAFFEETAGNEKEHAKIWFKLLHDGDISDTMKNLEDAANGENYEWTEMYAEFAKTAKEEGVDKRITKFSMKKAKLLGFAQTVDTFTLEKVLQKFVQFVTILKVILFVNRQTTRK